MNSNDLADPLLPPPTDQILLFQHLLDGLVQSLVQTFMMIMYDFYGPLTGPFSANMGLTLWLWKCK